MGWLNLHLGLLRASKPRLRLKPQAKAGLRVSHAVDIYTSYLVLEIARNPPWLSACRRIVGRVKIKKRVFDFE